MRQINLNRQLLGLEDILFGTGTVEQTRGGQLVTVTKVNASNLPFDETQNLLEWAQTVNLEELGNIVNELQAIYDSLSAINTIDSNLDNLNLLALNISCLNNLCTNIAKLQNIDSNMPKLQNIDANMSNLNQINTQIIPNLAEILLVDNYAVQVTTDKGIVASDKASVASMKLAVETIYDTFDDRFLGVKMSDPTVDNDGNALVDGAMYFNSSINALKVYDLGNTLWITIPQIYLSGLLDVTLTSITTGDILSWNGSKWSNTRTPKFNSIQLNGGTGTQGLVSWNTDEETLDVVQNGAVLQVGQEVQVHCRNNTASTIANGTVVMTTGTLGASGRVTIAPYDNTTDVKYVLGITTESIIAGDDGKVTAFGKIRGLNTSSWSEGSVLYTTTNGSLTSTIPTTGIKMPIAFVINSHSNNGTLMVRVTPINELATITEINKIEEW